MTAHSLSEKGWRRVPTRHGTRNELVQLGWSHFLLLIGILGGVVGMVVLALVAHLSSL